MQKHIITLFLLILAVVLFQQTFNGVELAGMQKGIYINVNYKLYDLLKPLETITNNYIQIDCN